MKANEFQIGDFVLINGKPHKIEMITKKKIGYHIEEHECRLHYSRICDIEPIPITADILLKNGFDTYGPDIFYLINDKEDIKSISIKIENGQWKTRIQKEYNLQRMYVDNVHELQHALRLCKIDKEITL